MWQVDEPDKVPLKYLLGELPDQERDQFEDRYFQDDAVHARLLALEDELIHAHLRSDLSSEQDQRFKDFFLRSPDRMEKLRFARALKQFADNQTARAVQVLDPRRLKRLVSFFDFHRPKQQPALAFAMLLMIVATMAVWHWHNGQSQIALSRIPLPGPAPQPAVPGGAPTPNQTTTVPGPVPLSVLSFVLLPLERSGDSPTRGGSHSNVISIPDSPHTVRLQVNLDADDFQTYRVTVRRAEAKEGIQRDDLKPFRTPDRKPAVAAFFPSEALLEGDYTLILEGKTSNKGLEPVAGYGFRVERAK